MRRAAFLKKVSRGTIARRLRYFGNKYRARNKKDLSKISKRVSHFQLDDLITKENSKLLPLSVTIAVNADNQKIWFTTKDPARLQDHIDTFIYFTQTNQRAALIEPFGPSIA